MLLVASLSIDRKCLLDAAGELFNRLIGRASDAPVVAVSTGSKSSIITTTPGEALAALNESAKDDYDPYHGDRPVGESTTAGSS